MPSVDGHPLESVCYDLLCPSTAAPTALIYLFTIFSAATSTTTATACLGKSRWDRQERGQGRAGSGQCRGQKVLERDSLIWFSVWISFALNEISTWFPSGVCYFYFELRRQTVPHTHTQTHSHTHVHIHTLDRWQLCVVVRVFVCLFGLIVTTACVRVWVCVCASSLRQLLAQGEA